jgi:hypothetical protein
MERFVSDKKLKLTVFTHFIFFITYEWAHKLECYIILGWNGVRGTKRSSLLGSFVSYEENEGPWNLYYKALQPLFLQNHNKL